MPLTVLTYSYQPQGLSDTCRCPSHSHCRGLGQHHLPHLHLPHQARHQKKPDTACPLMGHIQMSPWGLETESPTTRKFGISVGSTSLCSPAQAKRRLLWGEPHPATPQCRSAAGAHNPYFRALSEAARPTQPSPGLGRGHMAPSRPQVIPGKGLAGAPA